jgi:catechol 2,3-dioxygenase-like lactoylglutathione lyase family enzyme
LLSLHAPPSIPAARLILRFPVKRRPVTASTVEEWAGRLRDGAPLLGTQHQTSAVAFAHLGNRYEHLAIEVDSDLPAYVERLKSQGVKVLKAPKKSPGGTRWIAFVEDPNGIPVELLEPRPA